MFFLNKTIVYNQLIIFFINKLKESEEVLMSLISKPSPYAKSVFETLTSLQKGVLVHVYSSNQEDVKRDNIINKFKLKSQVLETLIDTYPQQPGVLTSLTEIKQLSNAYHSTQESRKVSCTTNNCDESCLADLVLGYEDCIMSKDLQLIKIISEVFQKGLADFDVFKQEEQSNPIEIDTALLNRSSTNTSVRELTKIELQKEMQMVLHMMKSFMCVVELEYSGTDSYEFGEAYDSVKAFIEECEMDVSKQSQLLERFSSEDSSAILRMYRLGFPILEFIPDSLLCAPFFEEQLLNEEIGGKTADTEKDEQLAKCIINKSIQKKAERINDVIRESEDVLRKEFEDFLNNHSSVDSLIVKDDSLSLDNLIAKNGLINFRNKIKFGPNKNNKEEYSKSRQVRALQILTEVLGKKFKYKKLISFYSQKMPSSEETSILDEILKGTKA